MGCNVWFPLICDSCFYLQNGHYVCLSKATFLIFGSGLRGWHNLTRFGMNLLRWSIETRKDISSFKDLLCFRFRLAPVNWFYYTFCEFLTNRFGVIFPSFLLLSLVRKCHLVNCSLCLLCIFVFQNDDYFFINVKVVSNVLYVYVIISFFRFSEHFCKVFLYSSIVANFSQNNTVLCMIFSYDVKGLSHMICLKGFILFSWFSSIGVVFQSLACFMIIVSLMIVSSHIVFEILYGPYNTKQFSFCSADSCFHRIYEKRCEG